MSIEMKPASTAIEYMDINALHPHPRNVEIYGDEDVTALQQSIQESGWIKPLTVNPEYMVISGHRRYQAAKALGYTKLPVSIEAFASKEAEMERLLRENENRGKTSEQQIREGMHWEPLEEAKAEQYKSSMLKQGNQSPVPRIYVEREKGEVIDIIARRVGLGSGDTYKKGRDVVKFMDEMFGIESERGDIIKMTLNDESINAASKLMKKYIQKDEDEAEKARKEEAERQRQQELARQRYLEAVKKAEHCKLYHCSVADLSQHVEPESVDWIICDPPYPREFLYTYSDLAKFALYALKPGGSLLAMSGQSYLPELIERLSEHLTYHWTACYSTPAPATTLYDRRLATSWKPLLWFTKGDYAGWLNGDVFYSEGRDKHAHTWGQSESGMADIIGRLTEAGQLVCDPFVGGGTTAVVAMQMERRFVGCDVDETCVRTLEERKASMVGAVQIEEVTA